MIELIRNKKFLAVYSIWILLHTTLLLMSYLEFSYNQKHNFWPFTNMSLYESYDISEWFVYIFFPIAIIVLIKELNKNN